MRTYEIELELLTASDGEILIFAFTYNGLDGKTKPFKTAIKGLTDIFKYTIGDAKITDYGNGVFSFFHINDSYNLKDGIIGLDYTKLNEGDKVLLKEELVVKIGTY